MTSVAVHGRSYAPPLGYARIGVGLAALGKAAYMGWLFWRIAPSTKLRIPIAGWLPDPDPPVLLVLLVAWAASAVAFTLGLATRASGAVLIAAMAATMTLDAQFYSNHLYLLVLLVGLLSAANAGAYRSLDARRQQGAGTSPGWAILLTRAQVSIVYLFAGLSKLNLVYVSGAILALTMRSHGPLAFPEGWRTPAVLAPLAVASILAEFILAAGLWVPELRRQVAWFGIAFHAAMILLVADTLLLAIFAVAMVSAYWAFFAPLPATSAAGPAAAGAR